MVFSSFSKRGLPLALCTAALMVAGSASLASDGTSASGTDQVDTRLVYVEATPTRATASVMAPAPQTPVRRAASSTAPARLDAEQRARIRHRLLNRWSAGEFR